VKRQIRQTKRQDQLLRPRENTEHSQAEQNQAHEGTGRKQQMRHDRGVAQTAHSKDAYDKPARKHKQDIMDNQQMVHRRFPSYGF